MKNKKIWLYFALLLPFIEPQLFKTSGFEIADKIFLVFKLVSSVIIAFEYMREVKYHFSKYVILMTMIQIATFIGTILNKGSISRFLGPAMISIVIIMLGELVYRSNWKLFFDIVEKYLSIFFVFNLISILLCKLNVGCFVADGPTFLGIDNRWIYFLLPWTFISFYNSYIKHKRICFRAWVIYACSTLSLLTVWSVGALCSFLAVPICYCFFKSFLRHKRINKIIARLIFILSVIFNYYLVTEILLEKLSNIISLYLKKDITLSGRVYLWRTVLGVLKDSPFFGKGVQSSSDDMMFFYKSAGYLQCAAVNHPHNHYMNVAYHGGYVALLLFVLILFLVAREIDHISNSKLKYWFLSFALSVILAGTVDTLDFSLFYIMIPIIASVPKIEDKNLLYTWKKLHSAKPIRKFKFVL